MALDVVDVFLEVCGGDERIAGSGGKGVVVDGGVLAGEVKVFEGEKEAWREGAPGASSEALL